MSVVNLDAYKIFCEVAKAGSYAKASDKLYISIPAISSRIKILENALDVKLFFREKDGVRLTGAGNELFKLIDQGLMTIELAEKLVMQKNELDNAEITIGCQSHLSTYYLVEHIAKAKVDYPNLKINLVSLANSSEMVEMLENHKIDFAIDIVPIKKNNIVVEELKIIQNIFASKDKIKINDIKELENYEYILNFDYTISTSTLKEILSQYNIHIQPKITCDATEVRVEMIKQGLGIGYVMKEAVKRELENEELYEVKLPIKLPSQELNVIYVKEQLTKADSKFIKQYLK